MTNPHDWRRSLVWLLVFAVLAMLLAANERGNSLKGSLRSAGAAKRIDVPDDFATIQEAIDAAEPGDIIGVAEGMYGETISITKDRIILEGAGSDRTVLMGSSAAPVVMVAGARDVRITGVAVRGGAFGIKTEFASVTCSRTRLEDNTCGLAARCNSYARVEDSACVGNKTEGILVLANSSAYVANCELSRNAGTGVRIMQTSSATVTGSILTENGTGVQAAEGSSLSAIGNEITQNKQGGVDVTGHSAASLWGGNKIMGNADFSGWRSGIGVHHNSEVTIGFSENKDVIEANNGPGLFIANSSSLFLKSGIVSGNHGDGIHLRFDSAAHLEEGAAVIRNEGYGICCGDVGSDSKYWNKGGDLGSEAPSDTANRSGQTNALSF